ncbi:hypothetical protein B0H19DRAFT_1070240 [Mycena capillaripes]|nr:hypothetical protein B0H19DRAFT_1070240 [Mycena capillaripes]
MSPQMPQICRDLWSELSSEVILRSHAMPSFHLAKKFAPKWLQEEKQPTIKRALCRSLKLMGMKRARTPKDLNRCNCQRIGPPEPADPPAIVLKDSHPPSVVSPSFSPVPREYHEYIFANMNIHQNLKTNIRIRANIDGKYSLLFRGLAATNELLRALLCYLLSSSWQIKDVPKVVAFVKTDIRIRANSTATAIREYKYSLFANGLARIFAIFAIRGTLYLCLKDTNHASGASIPQTFVNHSKILIENSEKNHNCAFSNYRTSHNISKWRSTVGLRKTRFFSWHTLALPVRSTAPNTTEPDGQGEKGSGGKQAGVCHANSFLAAYAPEMCSVRCASTLECGGYWWVTNKLKSILLRFFEVKSELLLHKFGLAALTPHHLRAGAASVRVSAASTPRQYAVVPHYPPDISASNPSAILLLLVIERRLQRSQPNNITKPPEGLGARTISELHGTTDVDALTAWLSRASSWLARHRPQFPQDPAFATFIFLSIRMNPSPK